MIFNYEDVVKIIQQYFELIDSSYGGATHHIGDGDGISEKDADAIRETYSKYSAEYYNMVNNNYKDPSKNVIEIIKETKPCMI